MVGRVDDGLGEPRRAVAALLEGLVELGGVRAVLEREAPHGLELLVRVAGEAVDGDDGLQPELRDDGEMSREVRCTALDRGDAAVGLAPVVLERSDGGDEDDRTRAEPTRSADDVEELLHAHVGAEPALGDDVVAELERHEVGDERVVAVCDVRERPAVDECRLSLERLHEVRLDGVLEEHGHRARRLQLLGRHGLAVPVVRDGDRAEPLPQVVEVPRDGSDRHHLGGRRDVEAGLAHVAVRPRRRGR